MLTCKSTNHAIKRSYRQSNNQLTIKTVDLVQELPGTPVMESMTFFNYNSMSEKISTTTGLRKFNSIIITLSLNYIQLQWVKHGINRAFILSP